jgi:outer membrane protein
MKRLPTQIALVLSWWMLVTASAGMAQELSLPQAVAQALAQYPTVGIAEAEVERAGAAQGEALAAWLPSLTFTAAATRYEEQMPATPIHGFTPATMPAFNDALGQYGLTVGYTVFDGGSRRGKTRSARSRLELARASSADARQQLIAVVVNAYLAVLSGREILGAHDHRLAAMQAELARAEQFFAQEKAAKVEILRVQAALAAAEAERERAQARLVVAEKNLASLTGADPLSAGTVQLLPVSMRETTVNDAGLLYAAALSANPAIEQARRRLAAANADIATAKGARLPSVKLSGNWLDQGDFDGNRVDEWNVGAALTFPLFAGGAIKHRIGQTRAVRRLAEEQLRLAEIAVQREIDQVLARLVETRSRTASLARAVETYAEVARIEQLLVKTGGGTQTDYLDAEAELVSARAGLAEARHAVIAACVELARLTGKLDEQWLSRHVENKP